jgi:phage regulator Rha-like protein
MNNEINELSTMTKQTMSSLEIAKLTEKEHSKVMAYIRRILDEVGIGHAYFGGSYRSEQNKELSCFNLPRRECDLIIAGYSAKYRLAIIDRWQELEEHLRKPKTELEIARDYVAALEAKEAALETVAVLRIELKEAQDDNRAVDTMLEMNLRNKAEDSEDNPWSKQQAAAHITRKLTH